MFVYMEQDQIIITVPMWYDLYEAYFGDGYYPYLKQDTPFTGTDETFLFDTGLNIWQQQMNSICYPIRGFDGTTGIDLLHLLNTTANVSANQICNFTNTYFYTINKSS